MRGLQTISGAVALLLMLSTAACGGALTGGVAPPTAMPVSEDPEKKLENLDTSKFDHPTRIDNAWLPIKPGTRMVYEGTTIEEDGTAVPHRIVLNVTDLTKVIGGVRSVVGFDLDYSDNQLAESELVFFAQDNDGNVWRMGEYPEVYEEGKIIETPAWIHGLQDARAGIMMPARPQTGTPSYSQGWGPAVNWTDRGRVDQMGQKTCVPVRCYEDVLVIAETSRSETDAQQLKYHARGVGNVRVAWRGAGEKTKETLELVKIVQLSAEELAEVRAKALEQEKRAYETSKEVYAYTPPAQHLLGAGSAPTAQASSGGAATPTGVSSVPTPPAATPTGVGSAPTAQAPSGGAANPPPATGGEVVVNASDLPASALSEFVFWDDPAAAGGKLAGTANTGGHLDPPPEDDPHVTFKVAVQGGIPYRCWIHMKVGAPKGESQANLLWVQVSNAVDKANKPVFKPDTGSYLTAQGPAQVGWAWVACDFGEAASAGPAGSLITFAGSGEVSVRLQAGMEGVGFDQFVLSSARFLTQPPTKLVAKP